MKLMVKCFQMFNPNIIMNSMFGINDQKHNRRINIKKPLTYVKTYVFKFDMKLMVKCSPMCNIDIIMNSMFGINDQKHNMCKCMRERKKCNRRLTYGLS